jgi:enoyl-CoA hydratase/carnithine racemase
LSRPFKIEPFNAGRLLRLTSADGMNRLTHSCILALTETVRELASRDQPLILAGNSNFFSVGADLNEISRLSGPEAYEFSKIGANFDG